MKQINFSRFSAAPMVAALASGLVAWSAAGAQEAPERWKSDGTVVLDLKEMPMSGYVSDAFKQAYLNHQNSSRIWPVPPALDAPKAAWDNYDAAEKRMVVGPTLAIARRLYPVDVQDTQMAGVHVGIVTPKSGVSPGNKNRILINVHGGGFSMGRGLDMGLAESVPIAGAGGYKVITLDYRQAPYDQFPAASQDVEKVYRELLKTYRPEAIGIYGCSAGGMLTGQSVAWFQAKGLPRPGAIGIFCAATLKFGGKHGDSDVWGPTGSGALPPENNNIKDIDSPRAYLGTAEPNDPLAYPGTSDAVIAKFPPTLFLTGTRAMEMSAAAVSHAQMLRLGVDSQLYLIEAGWHGATVISGQGTPEITAANAYVAHWFDQKLAK